MLFLLATPEYTNLQSNTTKVKVHLRNGIAEVLDHHQDLMGRVENNLVEIETTFENRVEKVLYILQDAVFVVSNQGLDTMSEIKGTSVYIYAKKAKEMNSAVVLDEVVKEYNLKSAALETEEQKLKVPGANPLDLLINSKIILLKDEVNFYKKVVSYIKELKGIS